MRHALVIVHRYVGLVMAGFLVIAGLTGALIVWYPELDAALNPALMRVQPPSSDAAPTLQLDPLVLRERVQAAYPGAWVHWVPLHLPQPDVAAAFWIEGAAGADGVHQTLAVDEVFVDPYTGKVLGGRLWGDISAGTTNLMPFLYRLHYTLALGTIGTWIFGIVALAWTLDCFVGAWLTLPARKGGEAPQNWWTRWAPAWRVRWFGGLYRLNVDLHRAGGLWPWAALFVLAWSSVAFNLYEPVYRPVMGMLFEFQPDPRSSLPRLAQDEPEPELGWSAALAVARSHMATLASSQRATVLREDRLSYDPHRAVVRLEVRTDRDVSERRGRSAVFVNSRTGELLASRLPTGEASGDTVTAWLLTLHLAHVGGMPVRIIVTLAGVLTVILSATGVVIWWRKRQGRLWKKAGVTSR